MLNAEHIFSLRKGVYYIVGDSHIQFEYTIGATVRKALYKNFNSILVHL